MTKLTRRWPGTLTALLLAVAATAIAAPDSAVVYFPTSLAYIDAYLIDWQMPGRAHIVTPWGGRDGTVAGNGARRVITLDQPFSTQTDAGEPDSCGDFPLVQQDTLQIGITIVTGSPQRGTSSFALAGTQLTLTGCDAGKIVPTGSLDVPYLATRQLPMSQRPSVDDLQPGVALAGPGEVARDGGPAADVLTLQAGGQGIFATSGNVVSAAFSADRWLVLGLPAGERAYTRISVDHRTGAETWIDADWSGGQPTSVRPLLMVKPGPGAGFGDLRRTARVWESGLFIGSRTPSFVSLFQDGTGDRLLIDLDAGTESHTPITWVFSGTNIVQSRIAGTSTHVRHWKPLLNGGGRSHFVMEDEISVSSNGTVSVRFLPRVNFYVDNGAATPPPAR
jgi:hypothetical protein